MYPVLPDCYYQSIDYGNFLIEIIGFFNLNLTLCLIALFFDGINVVYRGCALNTAHGLN